LTSLQTYNHFGTFVGRRTPGLKSETWATRGHWAQRTS
jgi:hypothetical protein